MPALSEGVVDDPEYGRAAPALGWVPAPRYLLRRDAVLRRVKRLPRGAAVEIGCGAGALVADLRRLGFACDAMETSADARALAARLLADVGVTVRAAIPPEWHSRFDLLLALEVLEHIEDDAAALREWAALVRPGGRLLLSVPAHARRWSPTDVWAGHFRRYDRSDFIALAEGCGLRVVACDNYGYPVANLTHGIKAVLARRQLAADHDAAANAAARAHRTAESGVQRDAEARAFPLLTSGLGRILMRAAMRMQTWFARSELGNGFLLEAVRP